MMKQVAAGLVHGVRHNVEGDLLAGKQETGKADIAGVAVLGNFAEVFVGIYLFGGGGFSIISWWWNKGNCNLLTRGTPGSEG